MSNLLFKRLRICSESEQAAMELEFHRYKTLLWGPNGAGKSAVLKSVFRAFDAEPLGELPGWDYSAIVAVDFEVEGATYTAVRRQELRALFKQDRLIGAATSSLDWNRLFAEATSYKLNLVDRDGRFRHASPATYFLPFFINQDGSFEKSWDTFDGLSQFMSPAAATLEYFARVRPLRYFELKANEQAVKSAESDLRVELATLQRTRIRLKKNLKTIPIKISEREFQTEVRELTTQLAELSKSQDNLRRSIVEDQDAVTTLVQQIRLSEAALKEHAADFKFAADISATEHCFICPTCHAEHDDSFHTFLGLAEDAREVVLLKNRMESMLESTQKRLERNRRKAVGLKQDYARLQGLLATKRGRYTFKDFLNNRSAFFADEQLASEENAISKELDAQSQSLQNIKNELKQLSKSHDPEEALNTFRGLFQSAIDELDADRLDGIEKWRIDKRPYSSGSRRARALIAYYSSLWRTIEEDDFLPSPVVVDSPNQGAQDRKHLLHLLTSLAARAPKYAQVILAHEEETEEFGADKVVEFPGGGRILSRDKFYELFPQMFRYIKTSRASLATVKDTSADIDTSPDSLGFER